VMNVVVSTLHLRWHQKYRSELALAVFLICIAVWGSFAHSQEKPAAEVAQARDAVQIQMKNVNLLLNPEIVLGVRTLRGRLERARPEIPVTFDDSDSFSVDIDSANITLTPAGLSALMNSYVFAYKDAPIKNVTTMISGGRLIQKGTIHKAIDVPFEIDGSVYATRDGKVGLHADSIKAARLPVKGLLDFLGKDISSLIHENQGRGIEVQGDDIVLAPERLTPPPHIHGRVRHVDLSDGRLLMFFDSGRHPAMLKPPFPAQAYIYHRGGVLRFGKLTMSDADLEIVGDRPGAFNFFQREYKRQLVAGYSKNTPADGLVAHMFDYSHFESRGRSRNTKAGLPPGR
jgi:hypothetical protein